MSASVTFEDYSCKARSSKQYDNFGTSTQPRRWYQHDIDQIVYSSTFRKLQKKHQLLSELDSRCRTRMVHTLEVIRIAKEIGQKFKVNTELVEGIALAHDVANSAYGSITNQFLRNKSANAFTHEEASMLMIKHATKKLIPAGDIKVKAELFLKRKKIGRLVIDPCDEFFLNGIEVYRCDDGRYYYSCISDELLDGVKMHSNMDTPCTVEGQIVSYSDNIAYISQDIEDLIATEIWSKPELDEFKSLYKKLCSKFPDPQYYDSLKAVEPIFSDSESERMGTLIKLFISNNEILLSNKLLKMKISYVLKKKYRV